MKKVLMPLSIVVVSCLATIILSEKKMDTSVLQSSKTRTSEVRYSEDLIRSNTTIECRFSSFPIRTEKLEIDSAPWLKTKEVVISRDAVTGVSDAPFTFVRSLWTKDALYFYVEVENYAQERESVNNDHLWMGSNVEFLISPTRNPEPFQDEFEFLFNSDGCYTDLRWIDKCNLETAIAWCAKDMEFKKYDTALFHARADWSFIAKIPFSALEIETPSSGDVWGLGLYRKIQISGDIKKHLAWSPTLENPVAFHVPEKFGTLAFEVK